MQRGHAAASRVFNIASRSPVVRAGAAQARHVWPWAVVLALGLGLVIVVGANLSTSRPSSDRPFGWPGASDFDNAVAAVRSKLVLAATIPALAWGIGTGLRTRDVAVDARTWTAVVATDLSLIGASVLAAAGLGAWGASDMTANEYWAFSGSHALLAASFYAIARVAVGWLARPGAAVAVGAWLGFAALYENVVRWRVFREAGYDRILAGDFPAWFYAAQVLSPVETYRGLLILWEPGFMDWEEQAVLGDAVLPAWLTPFTFGWILLVVWVVVPLQMAALAWAVRRRRDAVGADGTEAGQGSEEGRTSASMRVEP